MVRSTYEALYKVVMNINEDGCRPHGWHGLDGDQCIKRDTPTIGMYYIKWVHSHFLFDQILRGLKSSRMGYVTEKFTQ